MPPRIASPRSGPRIVTLMRKMHALEEERKGLLQELSALGAPAAENRRRRDRANGVEDFDLVAMWTETSETLQGIIAEREAQLDSAVAR